MEANRAARKGFCASCYRKAVLKCGKCDVNYCSEFCQRKHWHLGHKGDCGMQIPKTDIPARELPYTSENAVVLDKTWRKVCGVERSNPRTCRGLRNLGNTCFVNASLQMLLRASELVQFLQQETFELDTLHASLKEAFSTLLALPTEQIREKNETGASNDERSSCHEDVVLCGLQENSLNGLQGTVLGMDDASERYRIKLYNGNIKGVKARNLVCTPWSPEKVCDWLPKLAEFNFGEQEDAHEFIASVLRALEKEELQAYEQRRNITSAPLGVEYSAMPTRTFGGQLVSETICPKCMKVNFSFDHFQFLSMAIDGEFVTSLDEALQMFTAPERLDKQNRYRCEDCEKDVRARRRLMLYDTGPCLLVQLKRFTALGRGKIHKKITIQTTLNLAPYKTTATPSTGPCEYTLTAVVVHLDSGSSFYGHYITYAIGPPSSVSGSPWYRLDDGKVTSVEEAEVLAAEAYLLLYQACAIPPLTPGREALFGRGIKETPRTENVGRCQTKDCEFAAGRSGYCSQHAESRSDDKDGQLSTNTDRATTSPRSSEVQQCGSEKKDERRVEEKKDIKKPEEKREPSKKKLGPNDPCLCGSGKKYKKCHGGKA